MKRADRLIGWLLCPEDEYLPAHFKCLTCGHMECLGAVWDGSPCGMCEGLAPALRRARA